MNPSEFSALIKEMQVAFPNATICPDDQSKTFWFRSLEDLDFKQAWVAVGRHACTSKYPPSIAEIRDQAVQATEPNRRDWLEGWADVQRAIHRWGMYSPQEALDALKEIDPLTSKVAEMLGWQNLCLSENPIADRANFRQCYETAKSREMENAKLPPVFREAISGVADKLKLGNGGTP